MNNRYTIQLIQFTLATLIQRFIFELDKDTSFNRNVKVVRESLVTSPSYNSKGIRLSISKDKGLKEVTRQESPVLLWKYKSTDCPASYYNGSLSSVRTWPLGITLK